MRLVRTSLVLLLLALLSFPALATQPIDQPDGVYITITPDTGFSMEVYFMFRGSDIERVKTEEPISRYVELGKPFAFLAQAPADQHAAVHIVVIKHGERKSDTLTTGGHVVASFVMSEKPQVSAF